MKNGKPLSVRGYIRPTTRYPREEQLAAIEWAQPDEIYEDDGRNGQTIDEAINSLRHRGDKLVVPSLRVMGTSATRLRSLLDRVHAIGAVVVDGQRRRSTRTKDVIAMIADATKREGHSSEVARRGAYAGFAKRRFRPAQIKAALKHWRDENLTNREFVQKTGISYATMRRHAGPRGTPPGRKRDRERELSGATA